MMILGQQKGDWILNVSALAPEMFHTQWLMTRNKRFYMHMFFWIIYTLAFEISATASCGNMVYMYIYKHTPTLISIYFYNITGTYSIALDYFFPEKSVYTPVRWMPSLLSAVASSPHGRIGDKIGT